MINIIRKEIESVVKASHPLILKYYKKDYISSNKYLLKCVFIYYNRLYII